MQPSTASSTALRWRGSIAPDCDCVFCNRTVWFGVWFAASVWWDNAGIAKALYIRLMSLTTMLLLLLLWLLVVYYWYACCVMCCTYVRYPLPSIPDTLIFMDCAVFRLRHQSSVSGVPLSAWWSPAEQWCALWVPQAAETTNDVAPTHCMLSRHTIMFDTVRHAVSSHHIVTYQFLSILPNEIMLNLVIISFNCSYTATNNNPSW